MRYRAGFKVLVDSHECESGLRDFLHRDLDLAATPCSHSNRERRMADPYDLRIQTDFVTHEYWMVKNHPVDSNGDTTTPGSPSRGISRRQVHLRHQPTAKNVARGVCISGHSNRPDQGFTSRRLWQLLH